MAKLFDKQGIECFRVFKIHLIFGHHNNGNHCTPIQTNWLI